MNELDKQSWYSGEWTAVNNPQVPYNGLVVFATPNYGPETSPPTPQQLISVLIEVVDYTYDPNGVSSQLTLTKSGWTAIPIPDDNSLSPPEPNLKFTVAGIQDSGLGQIRLDTAFSGIYLNIQFKHGVIGHQREEIGYIMRFFSTYPQNDER